MMPPRCSIKTGISIFLALQFGLSSLSLRAFAEDGKSSESTVETKSASDKKNSAEASPEKDTKETPPLYPVGLDKKTLKLINRGEWKEVAARLESLTKKDKTYSRKNVWLAFAYMFLNRKKDLEDLSSGLEEAKDPDQKTYAQLVDAFKMISDGKSKEAAKALEGLPRQHANDALVNFALAAVSGKNGAAGAAIEYSKRAVQSDPDFAWGYRTLGYLELRWLNRPQEAEAALKKALEIEPDQDEVRNMLVRSMLGHNDFDGAIDISKGAVKIDSKNAENYLRLATIYLRQWRLNEATEELNKAIKINPDNAVYFRRRAGIKQFQGDLKAAIQDQSKAVALSKDKSFELVELAKMNIAAGNIDPAVANLNEALKRNPKNREAHRQLTTLLKDEKRYGDLVSEYRRALKLEEKNSNLHYLLADALMSDKKTEEALDQYKQAANLNAKDVRPLRKLGTYYSENKLYDKAIKAFRKALNINPTSVQDMVALGYCYAQDDNYLQSEAAFVTALALKQLNRESNFQPPSRQDIVRTLASLLLMEGRYADARNQFSSLYSMTQNTVAKNIDAYLLAKSEALSSPVESNIKKMIDSYGNMSAKEKMDYRYSFVQALIKVDKASLALKELSAVDEEEFKKEPKWNILAARANREQGSFEIADELISESVLKAGVREENEPSLVSDALVEKARLYMAQDKDDKAEAAATKALETYTKAYASYLVLGQISFKQGEYEKTIDLLKKALDQNPYYTEAYLLTGDAYMKLNDDKAALDNYKKALEVHPGSLSVHRSLLKVYNKLEMEEEANKEKEQIDNMEKLK